MCNLPYYVFSILNVLFHIRNIEGELNNSVANLNNVGNMNNNMNYNSNFALPNMNQIEGLPNLNQIDGLNKPNYYDFNSEQ